MTRILLSFLLAILALTADAQVSFTKSMKQTAPDEITISFVGKIDKGWHVYAPNETNGPIPASFNVDKIEGAKLVGGLKANKAATTVYEDMFGGNVHFFTDGVTFTQKVKLTGKTYKIAGYMEYGACNEDHCLPPTSVDFEFEGKGVAEAPEAEDEKQGAKDESTATDSVAQNDTRAVTSSPVADSNLWESVTDEFQKFDDSSANNKNLSLWSIFLLGILGGFIALLTPCVWPIIPMTVSFFLKRASKGKAQKNGDEKAKGKVERSTKGIRDAIIYGISIIVIYLALGLAVTAIFGASALNALSTNAVFNIFFFLLLVLFGASFLGGFELALPSSWANAVDSKATKASGMLSIFLMAFTLALVSFSCTGPIIGFLLVEMGTSGNILGPAVGMFGFALALALPFTLFAIFPTWLKSVPKSGNWMNNIKVTLGFVELAFSLKFLSVADLAYGWHILDRETFLALWIVLFALLGCYLIGWIRFPHDEEEYDEMGEKVLHSKTSVIKFFVALCSFAFAIYMVPGLWGAPCKAVSAFAPPVSTQDFNLTKVDNIEPRTKDFKEGMLIAQKEGKPVMIDFTGFGCVNCRKMEAAVWTDETVKKTITNDYVLIQLYVDDKTPLAEPVTVIENGQMKKLRTVGDKWSYLQRIKFGCNTQPYYVLLDNGGHLLNYSYSYDEDIDKYLKFLNGGLKNYKAPTNQ